jgi:hypothetical protein
LWQKRNACEAKIHISSGSSHYRLNSKHGLGWHDLCPPSPTRSKKGIKGHEGQSGAEFCVVGHGLKRFPEQNNLKATTMLDEQTAEKLEVNTAKPSTEKMKEEKK